MQYVADGRIEWRTAEVVLSARQRFGIIAVLTISAWAVPSALVYGVLQLL
jgi:hypothetical protein